jgi:hypothetical protein
MTDTDCPQIFEYWIDYGVFRFECRNRLCQNRDLKLYPLDRINDFGTRLMCVNTVSRDEVISDFFGYHAWIDPLMAQACGEDWPIVAQCRLPLPEVCLQP